MNFTIDIVIASVGIGKTAIKIRCDRDMLIYFIEPGRAFFLEPDFQNTEFGEDLEGANRLVFSCNKEDRDLIVRFSDNGTSFDPVGYSSEEKPCDSFDEGDGTDHCPSDCPGYAV